MNERRDPYVVLGVGRDASAPEIARAFRRAARATHPDTGVGGSPAVDRFRAVSDAYETLRDPERRAAYDQAHPPVRQAIRPAQGQHIVLGASQERPLPWMPMPLDRASGSPLAQLVLSMLRSRGA